MPPNDLPQQQANLTFGITRKSVEGLLVHACPHCGAPGLYKADEHNAKHWPGVINIHKVNQPVGDTCPNCQKSRRPPQDLGELTASMPLWIWNTILGFKWCVLKVMSFKT